MRHKLLSVLLITMMLFSMVPGAAFAADGDFEIAIGTVNGTVGEKVTVKIEIVNNPGVAGFQYALDYDKDVLEFVEVVADSNVTGYMVEVEENVAAMQQKNLTDTGVIAEVVFEITDKAENEAYAINLTGEAWDNVYDTVTSAITAGAVTVTGVVEPEPEPQLYAVKVENGDANPVEATEGTTVTVTANVPEDKEFVNWTGNVTFADENAATTTFTMPANDVSVTAVLKDKAVEPKPEEPKPEEPKPEEPVKTYSVIVDDGIGDGSYAVGETVTIKADAAPEGKTFNEWKVLAGGVELENKYAAETTFVMPDMDVHVDADYKTKSSGGSGGGIGGGGGAIIAPSDKDTNKDDAKQDAEAQKVIVLTIGEKEAMVDNKVVVSDVAPLIKEGRTYTPARFVAEQLGAKVTWNEAKQLVTVTKGDIVIELTINSTVAKVNGKAVEMDAAAFIRDSRTYTPARFVAEQLGAKVVWDDTTRQVTITAANI